MLLIVDRKIKNKKLKPCPEKVFSYFLLLARLIAASVIIILLILPPPHTQLQPSYFTKDNAAIDNTLQITVYLRAVNVDDSISFNITTAYIDDSPNVILFPPFATTSKSIVQKFIIKGNGTSWTDGNIHAIRFVSSDGYVDTFIIDSN